MQDDNRETKTEMSIYEKYLENLKAIPLSEYEREDIFMIRWITQAISGMIICTIILSITQNDIWAVIMFFQSFIYPFIFWRKKVKGFFKNWWNLLRGRRA